MTRSAKLKPQKSKLESFTVSLLESNTFFVICQEKHHTLAVFLLLTLKNGNSIGFFVHVMECGRNAKPGSAMRRIRVAWNQLFFADFLIGNGNRMGDGLPFELAEESQCSNGDEAQHKDGEGEDRDNLAAGGGKDPVLLCQQG